MILDEYIRGALSLIRWRGRKLLNRAERRLEDERSSESETDVSGRGQTVLEMS
ncbi:hypothetical protein D3C78_1819610 [compost metagenome]